MAQDIPTLIAALEAAWNRKDAVSFAACFDAQAEFGHVMDGALVSRRAIEEGHAALFAGIYADSAVIFDIRAVRAEGDWAMTVDLAQTLEFELGGACYWARSEPQLVLRRDGEDWTIATFTNRHFEGAPVMPGQSLRAAPAPAPTPEPEACRRAA
jgi:uncharacterized protein (TIGR02246 family)